VQTVTVTSKDPQIQCIYSVADGETLTARPPCRIEVPWSKELSLEVRRHGHSPWVRRWQVKGNHELSAKTLADERKVTVSGLDDAPAQEIDPTAVATSPDAGPTTAAAPERPRATTRRARRRHRRRSRRRRARGARTKRTRRPTGVKKAEPAQTASTTKSKKASAKKKGSKRVGAGTLDF
jgi:hypothetical protein